MIVLSYSWQKYKKGLEWEFTRGKAGLSQGEPHEVKRHGGGYSRHTL